MADSEEAHRLKTLAEQEFSSGNLISSLKHAKHARTIEPDLPGLPELVTALKIIRAFTKTPTPDYYKALQLEPFSHINAIKKQYKKLALALHPDKNPFPGCDEAFKAVGEAMGVFSDKIRRKEYDMRLRISLQEAAAAGGDVAVETFGTACGACGSSHRFEKRYLGHILVCPGCKNSFKAVEAEDADGRDGGENEEDLNVEDGGGIRASARIRGKAAKGWSSIGVKRKVRSVEEVLERSVSEDSLSLNDLRSRLAAKESEGGKGAMENDEEKLTLSEMQVLARKKKKSKKEEAGRVGEFTVKENEDGVEQLRRGELQRDEESETLNKKDKGIDGGEKETVNMKIKTYTRRGKNYKSSKSAETMSELAVDLDAESGRALDAAADDMAEMAVQNGTEEDDGVGGKRERRRVSRYGGKTNPEERIKENISQQEIREVIDADKSNHLEIIHVEESDFYDFDRDRKAKCFKNDQVWAVYDDLDGMPRHYALIHKVSTKPFEAILSWLSFEHNADEDSLTWHGAGYQAPCGRFKVSVKASINILKLFSHVVNCERVARELYRVYPHKGSVWALYKRDDATQNDEKDKDKQSFDVVIALSSYSDVYGLSVARLVRADGFKTVFKRREVGPKAVLWLRKNDVKLFSHQIPAKKVSGHEALNLPEHCWELDPASLLPELVS